MGIKDLTKVTQHLLICNGSTCTHNGADQLTKALRAEITKKGLDDQIHTTKTLCTGRCNEGPIVIQYPKGVWYKYMSAKIVQTFVKKQIQKNQPLKEHILYDPSTNNLTP
jgi:(2Fe-2S) ferredoxin